MATTTDITFSYSGQYTWDTAPLLWSDSASALRTWDVSYATINYVAAIGETFAFAEAQKSTIGFNPSDSLTFAEALANGFGLNQSESFVTSDTQSFTVSQALAESVAFAEAPANSVTKPLTDAFGVSDSYTNFIGLNPMESVTFVEINFYNVAQSLSESINFAELLANSVSRPISESFALSDAYNNLIGFNPAEAFAVAEAYKFNFYQALAEAWSIADGLGNTIGLNPGEAFAFVETNAKNTSLAKAESFAFAEACANVVGFYRAFNETVAFSDALANNVTLYKSETLQMLDAWRRQGDLVISDMLFAEDDMTVTDFNNFMRFGTIPGYERWRDFVPGDYEYQKAMFRVILETNNADRALLRSMNATIDVPDLIDHGSAYVTNATAGVAVTYSRLFHIVPEITLSPRSGSGSNPIVVEFLALPTKTGFTARLKDTITNGYVTGSFTWAAHGY